MGQLARSHPGSLRIAVIGTRGFPSTYGGFETFVRHAAPAWAASGHRVSVYCRSRPVEVTTRSWQTDGVTCLWTPGVDTKSASTLTFGLTACLDAATRGADVALVMNVANGFFVRGLRARGIPVVLNTDGVEWRRGKWGPVAKRVFRTGARLSASGADVLVADSKAIAAVWRSEFGADSHYIPYGAEVPATVDDAPIRSLGLTPHSYVLVVARLIPENNVELTLDALDRLQGTPAVVVGSAGSSSSIEQRLRTMASAGRLMWLGHVDDQALLSGLWAHAGVYVHGHSVGGTNPALLQALGAGAPTLALETQFNREVLAHDEQLYPPDADLLASSVRDVLASPSIRQAWGERGRQRIRDFYNWPTVIRDYEDLLISTVESRSTVRGGRRGRT